MIEARASLIIFAETDVEIDRFYAAINDAIRACQIASDDITVSIRETDREAIRL